MARVRSGLNLGVNYTEAQDGKIAQKEQQFKQKLEPVKGFDLSMINTHYQHRRRLRKDKMVLRYGELIYLGAKDMENKSDGDILCYARYSLMETVLIATNLTETNKKFQLELTSLIPIFKKAYSNNTVVMVKNLISDSMEPEYFFLREFVELRQVKQLASFRSLMISLTIC